MNTDINNGDESIRKIEYASIYYGNAPTSQVKFDMKIVCHITETLDMKIVCHITETLDMKIVLSNNRNIGYKHETRCIKK